MFQPGDSVVIVTSFKGRVYSVKKWKKGGKATFRVGYKGVCIGNNRYTFVVNSFGLQHGAELSEAEASEYLAKLN